MPKNLKSLLGRSRSKAELKLVREVEGTIDVSKSDEKDLRNSGFAIGAASEVLGEEECRDELETGSNDVSSVALPLPRSDWEFCPPRSGNEMGVNCLKEQKEGSTKILAKLEEEANTRNAFLSYATNNDESVLNSSFCRRNSSPLECNKDKRKIGEEAKGVGVVVGSEVLRRDSSCKCDIAFQKKTGPIKKSETVLALSTFGENTNVSSRTMHTIGKAEGVSKLMGSGASSATVSDTHSNKMKAMKDKIFSSSSSALNSFIQSSSRKRSKIFSGWRLPCHGSDSSECVSVSQESKVCCPKHSSSQNCMCSGIGAQEARRKAGDVSVSDVPVTFSLSRQNSLVDGDGFKVPLTPTNRLRKDKSKSPSKERLAVLFSSQGSLCPVETKNVPEEGLLCRLCLNIIEVNETFQIEACQCRYCKNCALEYVTFEIQQGAHEISCPDANCTSQGVLTIQEVETLVNSELINKFKKFKLFKEVELDSKLMWCQTPGCETICSVEEVMTETDDKKSPKSQFEINCLTCGQSYCVKCRRSAHFQMSCEVFRRKLIKEGKLMEADDDDEFPFETIKKCPFCHIPIEKDSGCAQMMCKRCKHVFCWYCLTSLDDDFLLRHYDKGPCKNMLGHSRASVVWHRTQVIGIFAGFGILMLLASPLLIIAAPCLLCCRCAYCLHNQERELSSATNV